MLGLGGEGETEGKDYVHEGPRRPSQKLKALNSLQVPMRKPENLRKPGDSHPNVIVKIRAPSKKQKWDFLLTFVVHPGNKSIC